MIGNDDGTYRSLLSNSIWLREADAYNEETVNRLRTQYFSSTFSGDMADPNYSKALRSWINENTGNLLNDQAESLKFSPDTVLALVSSIYFSDSWANPFDQGLNYEADFYSPGETLTTEYMKSGGTNEYFYQDENFTAVSQSLSYGGRMWLFLPGEGNSPEDIIRLKEFQEIAVDANDFSLLQWESVDLSIPKFDVVSDINLIPQFIELGVEDIFDPNLSDFSPLGDFNQLFVNLLRHAARAKIDEEGLTAAAYTVAMVKEMAALEEDKPIEVILDRPFCFVITNMDGCPSFIGIVKKPNGE